MNATTPLVSRSATSPSAIRKRPSLTELCRAVDAVPAPVIGRVLPVAGRDQVEVAAFNSSI